ncbi:hypothetical protein DID74_01660 [Candidatus Marinamargulisbacteria bacterium SCGC AG-333-B06]|nr:hypothetical protein DID74_01660 [Candidatus Marinamargulisbacteria bacterium SCGC AG-333-B06]
MSKKIPVLVISQLFYPELISTGQSMTELCEALVEKNLEIDVICAPPTIRDTKTVVPKIMNYRGINVRRVWTTRFPKLSLIGKLINQLTFFMSIFIFLLGTNKKNPILVFTNPPFIAWICALFRFCGGAPFIYTIYDVYPETAIQLGVLSSKNPISMIWRWLNRFVYSQADIIVVIGRCMETVIKQQLTGKQRTKLKRIHVYNDEMRLIKSINTKNPFISRWNLSGKFVVSYAGNMGRFHDMETIIKAAHILQDHEDILFLFIGDGYKKKAIMAYAQEHSVTNCQFHDYVERDELGLCLSSADIGLVSLLENQVGLSVPSKTMGLMAAGVPIIGILPSESEIALIIEEEACGYTIPTGNSDTLVNRILDAYNNPKKRLKMGDQGRKAVQSKYSLECAGNIYYDMITSLSEEI